MNKRIQQLVGQAGFQPNLNWDHTDWHAAGHSNLFEKFAELIVRECSEYLSCAMEVHSQQEQDLMNLAARKIKEYFGVENE